MQFVDVGRTDFLSTEDVVLAVPSACVQLITVDAGNGNALTNQHVSLWPTYGGCRVRRPDGTIVTYAVTEVMDSGAGYLDGALLLTIPVADYMQGLWIIQFTNGIPAGSYETTLYITGQVMINVRWGGTIDLLCQGAENAALARKALLNQWVPNSSTVPTALTLNDDGGGPLLTRTIANASATPVSPDQVLRLGKAV